MIVDLGTGDGRAARALARAEPGALVIGMDADAASMAEASRRAARRADRGGQPNLLFVVAAAGTPPPELCGLADEVRILFPWGSLLRGVLGRDREVAGGIAALVRPGARVSAIVSVVPTDRIDGVAALDGAGLGELAAGTEPAGLRLTGIQPVDTAEVRATGSTWGRRLLGSGSGRRVWRLDFVAHGLASAPGRGRSPTPAV